MKEEEEEGREGLTTAGSLFLQCFTNDLVLSLSGFEERYFLLAVLVEDIYIPIHCTDIVFVITYLYVIFTCKYICQLSTCI